MKKTVPRPDIHDTILYGWLPPPSLIDFFHSYPDAVTGFEKMSLGDVNVEPEGAGVILGRILRHQAILLFVDVRDEFNG